MLLQRSSIFTVPGGSGRDPAFTLMLNICRCPLLSVTLKDECAGRI